MNKKLFTFFSVILLTLFIIVQSARNIHADNINQLKKLITSNNSDYYSLIQLNGDQIDIIGKYSADPVEKITITGSPLSDYKINKEADGSFSATLVSSQADGFEGYLCIYLQSGAYMVYYICYDGGWYFPDNGLSERNDAKFDDIRIAAPSTAALYLSAASDADEVEETLSELEALADKIVGDEADDYNKARLICRWVADNIYYDKDAAEAGISIETVAVHNVLETRRTTCAGYANTFSALLEAAGIKSVNIKGCVAAGEVTYQTLTTGVENHEWVAFWYEQGKRWVYADACWNSRNYYADGAFYPGKNDEQYFDITTEALALNHRADKLEQRTYFSALEGLKPPTSVMTEETVETSAETEETEAETEQTEALTEQTASKTTSEISQVTEPVQQQDEGLNPLYVSIGAVLLIGIAVLVIYLASRRKGKNRGAIK